jgi:cytochrome c oxidase subunit II
MLYKLGALSMRKGVKIVLWFAIIMQSVLAFPKYNMPEGVTAVSHDIYQLHMLIFYICMAIGFGVFAVIVFIMVKHRKSRGVVPAQFHSNTTIEVVWTVIPLLILMAMAVPSTLVMIRANDASKPDINIKVVGFQWKWKYEYLDEGIKFFSALSTPPEQYLNHEEKQRWYLLEVDHPLVVPVKKKVRLLITSNDVNHSWWVPEFGVKKDAIPGLINEAWFKVEKPGTYRGQCTELCGMRHGYMPIVVVAKAEQDYQDWLSEQKTGKPVIRAGRVRHHSSLAIENVAIVWDKAKLLEKGKTVYNRACSVCHQSSGVGMPPAFPALVGSKVVTGPVADHVHIVFHGKPGTAMQAFSEQLSDEEIAAVITYQRHAWGNADKGRHGANAGGIVLPKEIKEKREP